MDNRLIFRYHFMSAQAESGLLRKALRGLPTQPVVGQRWSDGEGYTDPGDGSSRGKRVGEI